MTLLQLKLSRTAMIVAAILLVAAVSATFITHVIRRAWAPLSKLFAPAALACCLLVAGCNSWLKLPSHNVDDLKPATSPSASTQNSDAKGQSWAWVLIIVGGIVFAAGVGLKAAHIPIFGDIGIASGPALAVFGGAMLEWLRLVNAIRPYLTVAAIVVLVALVAYLLRLLWLSRDRFVKKSAEAATATAALSDTIGLVEDVKAAVPKAATAVAKAAEEWHDTPAVKGLVDSIRQSMGIKTSVAPAAGGK